MVYTVESTHERVTRELVAFIEEELSLRHSREVDLISISQSAPNTFDDPQFNVRLQDLPETRNLPVLIIRFNIDIGINRTGGVSPYEQDIKLSRAFDELIDLMRKDRASRRLQIREFRLINSDRQIRNSAYIRLAQFEGTFFQRLGEYRL